MQLSVVNVAPRVLETEIKTRQWSGMNVHYTTWILTRVRGISRYAKILYYGLQFYVTAWRFIDGLELKEMKGCDLCV